MGNVFLLPTIDVVKELVGNRFFGLNRRWHGWRRWIGFITVSPRM